MSPDQAGRLHSLLAREALVAAAWSNAPSDRYDAHRDSYDKVLVAAQGSIDFYLPERGQTVTLGVADRLDLPAGTLHSAVVGPDGVTCLEAHLLAGALPAGLRPVPGWGMMDSRRPDAASVGNLLKPTPPEPRSTT